MLPGPDNKAVPFLYTGQYSRRRRISFVDIDKRDMRFKVFVDGKLKQVSTDFELDKTLNCGQDALKCVEEGFSEASVIIPSGKHTIKVEWIGKGEDQRHLFLGQAHNNKHFRQFAGNQFHRLG